MMRAAVSRPGPVLHHYDALAENIKAAIETALENADKPTLICCRTKIGFGAQTKAGKESSHGAPLGRSTEA